MGNSLPKNVSALEPTGPLYVYRITLMPSPMIFPQSLMCGFNQRVDLIPFVVGVVEVELFFAVRTLHSDLGWRFGLHARSGKGDHDGD
jgi:hypothetical protein